MDPDATLPLLRLLQISSPAMPIGAFAYSQGLEAAVVAGWVHDEKSAQDWILGLLRHGLGTLDLPVLGRLQVAWMNDPSAVVRWNDFLFASRGSAELQAEDRHLGSALGRVLADLGIAEARIPLPGAPMTHATAYALAAARWAIPRHLTLPGYAFAWAEAQVGAATRLVPLGQSSSQRILTEALRAIPSIVEDAWKLQDEDLGSAAPAHAIACAIHEHQYSRLFRS